MKKLGIAALGIVALIGFAAYLLLDNLDGIVKSSIEEVGTEVTGTRVSLDGVTIDLSKGSATLTGLTIDNPKGYNSDYAFYLKKVSVGLDLASLKQPVIVINEVIVKGARLNAEQRGETTNLSDLLANVEAHSKKSNQPREEQPKGESKETYLALKKFVFANTEATLISEVDGEQAIKVPDVRRQNIGSPERGLTPEQLGDALLQAVLEEVEKAVVDHLADLAKGAIENKIREKIGLPKKD